MRLVQELEFRLALKELTLKEKRLLIEEYKRKAKLLKPLASGRPYRR